MASRQASPAPVRSSSPSCNCQSCQLALVQHQQSYQQQHQQQQQPQHHHSKYVPIQPSHTHKPTQPTAFQTNKNASPSQNMNGSHSSSDQHLNEFITSVRSGGPASMGPAAAPPPVSSPSSTMINQSGGNGAKQPVTDYNQLIEAQIKKLNACPCSECQQHLYFLLQSSSQMNGSNKRQSFSYNSI